MCNRIYPIKAWSRLGHRCDTCATIVLRGQLIYLTITGQYCSHLCEAIHDLTEVPAHV